MKIDGTVVSPSSLTTRLSRMSLLHSNFGSAGHQQCRDRTVSSDSLGGSEAADKLQNISTTKSLEGGPMAGLDCLQQLILVQLELYK